MEQTLSIAGSPYSERREGFRLLGNWLLCWIVLPNIAYWLMWIIGGPPRAWPIMVTGLIGLALHRAPFRLKYAGFVIAVIYSGLNFISALFNLRTAELMQAMRFASELQPGASAEYLIAGAGVGLTLFGGWKLLQRRTTLIEPAKIILAATLTFLAVCADTAVSQTSRGSYKRIAEPGAPFTSAAGQSGFVRGATGQRHLVMVVVEAMGEPADPALRRQLVDLWARPEVRARYTVTTGTTTFYGSTTSGELRELCGRWGDYPELIEASDARCLPARLAAKGYRSEAWHSFKGSFFDRTQWYPHIGFDRMRFGDELRKQGADWCPGVFAGACDRDVPRQIGAALKAAREPTFLYWLTLNSHVPVIADQRLGTADCAKFDAKLYDAFPMICRLFQLYDAAGRALAREITAADFPKTDILIVGDHLPPFFVRTSRDQFAPDRVPWIMLRAK